MLKGIDISSFQNPDVMLKGCVEFVMIKASEGVGYKDEGLDKNYNFMKEHTDISHYGFYHYARPDLGNSPEAEAASFLSYVGHHSGKCLYALDWEGKALSYPMDWCIKWLDYVYTHSKQIPLLYASASTLDGYMGRYPIWVAHWGVDKPAVSRPWAMWQYTDNGGELDGDKFDDFYYWWKHLCDGRIIGS